MNATKTGNAFTEKVFNLIKIATLSNMTLNAHEISEHIAELLEGVNKNIVYEMVLIALRTLETSNRIERGYRGGEFGYILAE